MVYSFKKGSRLTGDPNKVGQELESLAAEQGDLTPEVVERAARKKDSALHDLFEWDDTAAAYKYRLSQAAHILRCVVVIDDGPAPEPHVAYVRVDVPSGDESPDEEPEPARSVYRPLATVMSDAELRQQVLDRALAELAAFQKKYRSLSELADVFAAIDRAIDIERTVAV